MTETTEQENPFAGVLPLDALRDLLRACENADVFSDTEDVEGYAVRVVAREVVDAAGRVSQPAPLPPDPTTPEEEAVQRATKAATLIDVAVCRCGPADTPPESEIVGIILRETGLAEVMAALEMFCDFHGGSLPFIGFTKKYGMPPDRMETLEACIARGRAALAPAPQAKGTP